MSTKTKTKTTDLTAPCLRCDGTKKYICGVCDGRGCSFCKKGYIECEACGGAGEQALEAYDLPPDIAIALQTDRPQFVIVKDSDYCTADIARLIKDLIHDRVRTKQQVTAIEDRLRKLNQAMRDVRETIL